MSLKLSFTKNRIPLRHVNSWLACFVVGLCYMMPALAQTEAKPSQPKPSKPNVVFILADDMGFSDLGCYGGEIQTPNLNRLAGNGLRFTQFYNTSRCWPSRGAILTGYYAQQIHRDALPDFPGGNNGQRQAWAKLLPELLQAQGYRSYHSGKWHIDGNPLKNGFDHSYRFADNGRFFNPSSHFDDETKLPPVKNDPKFYGTTEKVTRSLKMLEQHHASHADQPFFLYLAFVGPHFPLQAPQEDIDRYRKLYQVGWDQLRKERYQRLSEAGIVTTPLSKMERDVGSPYDVSKALEILGENEVSLPVEWSKLTSGQKDFQATKMAIHAAMVDRMDREIGRLVAYLEATHQLDNTLILFLSDNGASAEILVRDDGHDPNALPGSQQSYLSLGAGGSSLANTPFRRHKVWTHEGGIATPLIAHWPAGIKAQGELRHTPGHLIDLVPTIFDILGAERPETVAGEVPPPFPGKSLKPVFDHDQDIGRDHLWWLHNGNRAIRKDDWKLVATKNGPWELYDLKTDRCETEDLSLKNPELLKELSALWEQQTAEFQALVKKTAPPRKRN